MQSYLSRRRRDINEARHFSLRHIVIMACYLKHFIENDI